jgi:hypothetical protein
LLILSLHCSFVSTWFPFSQGTVTPIFAEWAYF